MKAVKQFFHKDGWSNILTGLGLQGKDKRMSSMAGYTRISEGEAEILHASDEMAEKIINMLPLDMLREGFRVSSAELDEDVLENAMDYFEKLVLTKDGSKLGEAMVWGRLYGGAGLVIGTDSDEDVSEPLELDRIGSVTHFTLLSRWELIPQEINGDPTSPNFSLPETYLLQPRVSGSIANDKSNSVFHNSSMEIHESRVIRFDGSRLPRHLFISNHYWHDSILNKLQDDIRDYQATFASASALVLDFAQAVYKVKNLSQIVSSPDGMKTIQDRIAIIEMSRSILRAAIVDADGEDFERKTTSLAGLDKTLDMLARKFTSATEYPHTVLLGDSPGGSIGGNGNSEREDYHETIRSKQKQDLKPRLMQMFKLIFAAGDGPTGGVVPEKFDIEFEPLRHMTQKEMIESRNKQAQSDKIYMESGAVDPSEIASSRFGEGEYSFETEIDNELREKFEVELDKNTEPEPQDPNRTDKKHGVHKRKPKAKKSRSFSGKRY